MSEQKAKPGGRPAAPADGAAPRGNILSLTIKDKSALHASYMPYVLGGGLFIPTNKKYNMGDEVFMLLTLMNEPEKLPIAGTVCWITPAGAQGGRAAGVGVKFSEKDSGNARNRIEGMLGGALKSERSTHTM